MERNDERVVRGKDGNNSTPYLDRSKVRILLCDNDAKSSKEVFTLLCKCSYEVTSVRTPRQVIDALNAEGRDIDIILAEVDLPVSKGLKLLKYIMRDEELRRIPIIMMSAQDDVSVVVKCLKHGAADYLVKPLRTNELLNLWTHMWRRRHMLGLSEKKILNFDNDLVASDPSDANTNSTTLFSDDTDEKSRRSNILENSISNYREIESNVAACAEPALSPLSEYQSSMRRLNESTGQYSSCPKKSELKIGESSAFFTYVKSSISPSKRKKNCHNEGVILVESGMDDKLMPYSEPSIADSQTYTTNTEPENYHLPSSGTSPDITYLHRSPTRISSEIHNPRNSNEENLSTIPMHPRNNPQVNVLPYYMPHMLNPQLMMPSPSQPFQSNQQDFQRNTTVPAIIPQYNPHMPPMMTSFPYYSFCMQTGQMPSAQPWPSNGVLPSTKATKTHKGERREAALMKFRQKRKDRCFDKKIRYINRKRLAERRPRVRGQFVRQVNGVDVDLNGRPVSVGDSDEDEEGDEEEELASR